MSMIGANAQFAPTAFPSRAQRIPSLRAFSTSSVAAISKGAPTKVPSFTIPLPPFSKLAAINIGILHFLRNRLVAFTASSAEQGRYMTPDGFSVSNSSSMSFSLYSLIQGKKSCSIFSSSVISASVLFTHSTSASLK